MDQSKVSSALVTALIRESNDIIPKRLASLAGRSEPPEAARIYGQAAIVLVTALEHEKDANERKRLASGLASLAGCLDSLESARICGRAARSLADALVREANEQVQETVASGLSLIVDRMPPAEAAQILAVALKQGSNPSCLTDLAWILSDAVDRLDRAEANRICDQLIVSLDRNSFHAIAPELLEQLNPERANALAWELTSTRCSEPELDTVTFSRLLTDTSRQQKALRTARMVVAGSGLEGMLEAAAHTMAEPFPCRLTTQELVELLKMPTCFGAARRVVLDHLGNRYGRRFTNHWAFVRYAREKGLKLDLTTPPKRPDDKQWLGRLPKVRQRPQPQRSGFGIPVPF